MSLTSSFNNASRPASPHYPVILNNVMLDDIEKIGARGKGLFRVEASVIGMDPSTPKATAAFFMATRIMADIYYLEQSLRDRSSFLYTDKRLRPLELDELKFSGTMNGVPAGIMGKMHLKGVTIEADTGMICHTGPTITVPGKIIDVDTRWNAHNESAVSALGLGLIVETPLKKDHILKSHFFDNVIVSPPDSNGRIVAKDQRKPEEVPGSKAYLDRIAEATRYIALSDFKK